MMYFLIIIFAIYINSIHESLTTIYLMKDFKNRRWPTSFEFFMNISPTTNKGTPSFRYILPIDNIPICRCNFLVNFFLTILFCMNKMYDGSVLRICYMKQSYHRINEYLRRKGQRFKITNSNANALKLKLFFLLSSALYLYFPKSHHTRK